MLHRVARLMLFSGSVTAASVAWPADLGEIFDDANADLHDWVPACEQDRVTLQYSCTLSKVFPEATFTVWYHAGRTCVSPGPNDHPGAVGIVRVDKSVRRFQGEAACGQAARTLIGSMLKGQSVAVRTIQWPDQQIEYEFDLSGFAKAHAMFQQQIARLPK